MTLSYRWMHWFWITSRVCFAVSEDRSLTTHSIVIDPKLNDSSDAVMKAIQVPNTIPPISHTTSLPPPQLAIVKYPKPSPNKPQFHLPQKTTTVIVDHENVTSNVSPINITNDSQIVNVSLVDNFTLNESNYNQSVSTSERIIEKEEQTVGNLSAAGITGITLGCVVIVGTICIVSFVLYRNRGFNRPQVLNDRCSNPDSSGYIDDASVRDNSEEMYSLDNDSFLNSLEAMTIQNYWTDTVKHTKL